MDQKIVSAFQDSQSKFWRAAKILAIGAGIFTVLAAFSFYIGQTLAGVFQSIGALVMLFAAAKFRSAAKHLQPLVEGHRISSDN